MTLPIGLEAVSGLTAQDARTSGATRTLVAKSPAFAAAKPPNAGAIEKAREEFTAMVLQNFLEAAVPKNLIGDSDRPDAANGMWRSLLVEQLARSVASSGQLDVFGDVVDQRLVEPDASAPAQRRAGETA